MLILILTMMTGSYVYACSPSPCIDTGTVPTNIGIGTSSIANGLSLAQGLAVGDTTYTNVTAPANGAIIEGNTGIGNNSPVYILDVSGTARATGLVTTGNVGVGSPNPQGALDVEGTLSMAFFGGNVGIGTTVINHPLVVQGTTALRNTILGNVPLAITQTDSSAGASTTLQLLHKTTITPAAGMGNFFQMYDQNLALSSIISLQINAALTNIGVGTETSQIYFGVYSNGTSKTGVVINGSAAGSANPGSIFTAFNDIPGNAGTAPVDIYGIGGGTQDSIIQRNSSGTIIDVIQDNGNMGIGTSNPGQALDVKGTIRATAFIAGSTAGVNCSGSPDSSFATINGIVTVC